MKRKSVVEENYMGIFNIQSWSRGQIDFFQTLQWVTDNMGFEFKINDNSWIPEKIIVIIISEIYSIRSLNLNDKNTT